MKRKNQKHRKSGQTSIVSLIKEDHKVLKKCIATLVKPKGSPSQKRKALEEFSQALLVHAQAEQESLYNRISEVKSLRAEALEAQEEHRIAHQLIDELQSSNFEEDWNEQIAAKAKVAAEIVEHHLREEERDMLPDVRKKFSKEDLKEIGEEYTKLRENYEHMEMSKSAPTQEVSATLQ